MRNDAEAQRGLEDFWFFMKDVLEMPLQEKPHREMAEFLCDDTQPNKLLLVPRDCWKSSIGATALPLWMILRAHFLDNNPNYRVLVDSSTVRFSQFVIEAIGRYLKNCEPLARLYGNLYDRHQVKENWMSLAFRKDVSGGIREPHLLASGVNAAKTGLHFDLIVLDDLVTKENYSSLLQREKVWTHYRMMYAILEADTVGQKTFMHLHGTRYHDDDMYGRILAQERKRVSEGETPIFSTMLRSAIEDNGELFYPSVLTHDELKRRKGTMEGLFWAQYMNDPNKESAPFKADQLHFVSLTQFPDKLQLIRVTCDAAIKEETKEHGDFNCIVALGWDRWRKPWVLDVDMTRQGTINQIIDSVLNMAERWDAETVIVEDKAGSLLFTFFQQEMERRKKFFPFHMVKVHSLAGKESRWAKVQSLAERGGIHVANEIPEWVKLEILDEWTRAPFARFNDFMDALELHWTFISVDDDVDAGRAVSVGRNPLEILDGTAKRVVPTRGVALEDLFPHLKNLRAPLPGQQDPEPEPDELEADPLEDRVLRWL